MNSNLATRIAAHLEKTQEMENRLLETQRRLMHDNARLQAEVDRLRDLERAVLNMAKADPVVWQILATTSFLRVSDAELPQVRHALR